MVQLFAEGDVMMGGAASDDFTQSQHSSGNSSDRGHYDMTRIQHDHHASNRNSSEHGTDFT